MINKFKKYLRNVVVQKLSNIFLDIQKNNDKKEIENICTKLNFAGEDIHISLPSLIIGNEFISIGNHFQAKEHLRLEAIKQYGIQTFTPKIIIGNNVSMEFNCHIGAISKITIGDNVLCGSNIFIADSFHGHINGAELTIPPISRHLSIKGEINIGKNVWIGDSVCILSGVTIGENTIIGANSVVTKSFPASVVIAGCPAKIIKKLY